MVLLIRSQKIHFALHLPVEEYPWWRSWQVRYSQVPLNERSDPWQALLRYLCQQLRNWQTYSTHPLHAWLRRLSIRQPLHLQFVQQFFHPNCIHQRDRSITLTCPAYLEYNKSRNGRNLKSFRDIRVFFCFNLSSRKKETSIRALYYASHTQHTLMNWRAGNLPASSAKTSFICWQGSAQEAQKFKT